MLRSSTPPLLKLGIILLAAIPAATAALLYAFLGGFFAAHRLASAAALAVLAALLMEGAAPSTMPLKPQSASAGARVASQRKPPLKD
jgi:hypothetical protein